jgi:hypothetical protein
LASGRFECINLVKKMLGRGFDGLPLVVFEECSDTTVAAGFLGFVATRACRDEFRIVRRPTFGIVAD